MTRRGIGLTDIFLYLFVLMLLMVALVITGLGSFMRTTITIDDEDSQQMIRTSIVERSVLESLPLVPVEGVLTDTVVYYSDSLETIDYTPYRVSRSESLSMIATYVLHSIAGDPTAARPFPSVFYREPELHASHVRIGISRSPHDHVGLVVPARSQTEEIWLVRYDGDPIRVGIEGTRKASGARLVWVPGYVGSHPHARSVFLSFETPLEVVFDEG